MSAPGEHVVRGLRAAARATRRSASGVQKLVDTGRLPARRDGTGGALPGYSETGWIPLELRTSGRAGAS